MAFTKTIHFLDGTTYVYQPDENGDDPNIDTPWNKITALCWVVFHGQRKQVDSMTLEITEDKPGEDRDPQT